MTPEGPSRPERAGLPPVGGGPALRLGASGALLAWALLVVAAPSPLDAQSPACQDPVDLHLRVLSAADGSPVAGASVVLPGAQLRLLTDADGRFRAAGVCPGDVQVSLSHLAFGTTTRTVSVAEGASVELRLEPRAIPVEGVVVEVEPVIRQLERRRMAVGYKSGVFDATAFALDELPASIPEYLAARTGHPLTSCRGSWIEGRNCYPFRGGLRTMRICLNSAPLPGGVPVLEMLPDQDIARVEFYPALGMMKVFTRDFLVVAARKPWLIQGMWDGC